VFDENLFLVAGFEPSILVTKMSPVLSPVTDDLLSRETFFYKSLFQLLKRSVSLYFFPKLNGTARFFAFSLIIEGTKEKLSLFITPLKSIYNKNVGFTEEKYTFKH
jgi:hypothetical protein